MSNDNPETTLADADIEIIELSESEGSAACKIAAARDISWGDALTLVRNWIKENNDAP